MEGQPYGHRLESYIIELAGGRRERTGSGEHSIPGDRSAWA